MFLVFALWAIFFSFKFIPRVWVSSLLYRRSKLAFLPRPVQTNPARRARKEGWETSGSYFPETTEQPITALSAHGGRGRLRRAEGRESTKEARDAVAISVRARLARDRKSEEVQGAAVCLLFYLWSLLLLLSRPEGHGLPGTGRQKAGQTHRSQLWCPERTGWTKRTSECLLRPGGSEHTGHMARICQDTRGTKGSEGLTGGRAARKHRSVQTVSAIKAARAPGPPVRSRDSSAPDQPRLSIALLVKPASPGRPGGAGLPWPLCAQRAQQAHLLGAPAQIAGLGSLSPVHTPTPPLPSASVHELPTPTPLSNPSIPHTNLAWLQLPPPQSPR